jgi:hypothetical protein
MMMCCSWKFHENEDIEHDTRSKNFHLSELHYKELSVCLALFLLSEDNAMHLDEMISISTDVANDACG